MRIEPVQLKATNRFAQKYRSFTEDIAKYFDYHPFNDTEKRLSNIQQRSFPRTELVQALEKMNHSWGATEATFQQIERLHDDSSVVVIGGQQAGLFTGPLYTVNKIISILAYANQQEEKLNVPVIPVFWIAGEDHDHDEINHVYINKKNTLIKHTVNQKMMLKQSISTIELEKDMILNWIREAFVELPETSYTRELYDKVTTAFNKSGTFVDFFARIIFSLFPNEGLVLFDSGSKLAREIERPYFVQLIERQEIIAQNVYNTVEQIHREGYDSLLQVDSNDAHLFYEDAGERILLKREHDAWLGKNDEIKLTTEQLLHTATHEPEKLSNNVVTRPLMQELLFPTLAFVAGDGEISYWGALREAFHSLDKSITMPPVVPRLSFTLITKRVKKLLVARALAPKTVLNENIDVHKMNWLLQQKSPPVDQLYASLKEQIIEIHQPIQQLTDTISSDLHAESKRNLKHLLEQIAYLENRTVKKLFDQHELVMEQFNEIGNMIKPQAVLQERIWNPLPFLNECGINLYSRILKQIPTSFDEIHYFVYLDR